MPQRADGFLPRVVYNCAVRQRSRSINLTLNLIQGWQMQSFVGIYTGRFRKSELKRMHQNPIIF